MRSFLGRFFSGFKSLLFLLAVGMGLFLHLYTQHIINQLREESRSLVLFYAQMYAKVAETESSDDLSFLFDQVILRTNFPLINTDPEKIPVWWKGISVDSNERSAAALEKVKRMVRRMEKEIEPIPVRYGDTVLGYLYYGDSRLIQQLQWLPYVEVGVVGLFLFVGFIGYATIKRSEQRYIWVGMAKETAHQLGTPLSSLLGWLEVMRSKKQLNRNDVLADMERDLQRLERVTRRFSQIGSKPDLKEQDVAEVLKEVIEYIRRRAPQMGRRITITELFQKVPPVALNADILQWAVENLLKNCLDAMDKEEGRIKVTLGYEEEARRIFIEIQDNGRGMEKSQKKRIFRPGYSTKTRGWGLGLTLTKRIIEEYHGGKVFVKETKVGEGTLMRVELRC